MDWRSTLKDVGLVEFSIAQMIVYALIWLVYPYLGFLLTVIISPIALAIIVISWLADLLDPSRVGKRYYLLMWSVLLCPILIMMIFIATGIDPAAWFMKAD